MTHPPSGILQQQSHVLSTRNPLVFRARRSRRRRRRRPCPPPRLPGGAGPPQPDAAVRPPPGVPRRPPHARHNPPPPLHHHRPGPHGALPRRRHLRRLRRRRHGRVPRLRGVRAPAGGGGLRHPGGSVPVGGRGGEARASAGVRPAPAVGGARGAPCWRADRGVLLAALRGGHHLRGGLGGVRWPAHRGRGRAAGVAERRAGAGGCAVVCGGSGVVPAVPGRGGAAVRGARGRRRRVRQLIPRNRAEETVEDVKYASLSRQEADYLASTWRVKTVDPTLPSFYLDGDRLPSNKTYGFDLFDSTTTSMVWLDSQPPCSVIYASYGTVTDLDTTQLEAIGNGLCNSSKRFLWVVRSCDEHKLSEQLRDKCKEKDIIVSWCPQLEVLSHKATCMK